MCISSSQKNALLGVLRPEIGGWIRKHNVGIPVQNIDEFMAHARHAESVVFCVVTKRKIGLENKLTLTGRMKEKVEKSNCIIMLKEINAENGAEV